MVALGFWNLSLKTKTRPFSAHCQTVGEHLKRKRLQLGLLQKDVARIIKVSEDSVTYWENARSEPQIRYFPNIIKFLGYSPFQFDTTVFGEVIRKFRTENGLSYKQVGKLLGIDGSTIAAWEKKLISLEDLNRIEKLQLDLLKGLHPTTSNSYGILFGNE